MGRRHYLVSTFPRGESLSSREAANAGYGTPEIFKSDQGTQFTAAEFIDLLNQHRIRISMDGRGAWRDNVFVERLWNSIKYEEVHLHAYESISDATAGIDRYVTFCNGRRLHLSLDRHMPDVVYCQSLPLAVAA